MNGWQVTDGETGSNLVVDKMESILNQQSQSPGADTINAREIGNVIDGAVGQIGGQPGHKKKVMSLDQLADALKANVSNGSAPTPSSRTQQSSSGRYSTATAAAVDTREADDATHLENEMNAVIIIVDKRQESDDRIAALTVAEEAD